MLSFADAIIHENIDQVRFQLHSVDINQIDEYGFTPLIESAIADNVEIAKLLIQAGADANLMDMTGNTALHWAAENNNLQLAHLLLENGARPNAYTFAGQPVLVVPLLRGQTKMKNLLLRNGASLEFAQDYVNAKLLGHMFELVGKANIIGPGNTFIELDFEGFYLEFTLSVITESVIQFKNHFAARNLRRLGNFTDKVISALHRAAQITQFQQYRANHDVKTTQINALLTTEPLILPIGYEGHAITFILYDHTLVKCDRREESRLYDNIFFYHIEHPERMTVDFLKEVLFVKQSDYFINTELPEILGLTPMTELKISAQISGNCSWANVEAVVPSLFFLFFAELPEFKSNTSYFKNVALNFFNQWREWNKSRALNFCIQSFYQADSLRKACKAEILAAILFQTCKDGQTNENERIISILEVLKSPGYEYILQNYIKTYCYEDQSQEGQEFLKLLKKYGYLSPR